MELEPESASLSSQARAAACHADILARESSADEIDGRNVACDASDVVIARHPRPVFGEHCPRVWVYLALPGDFHPGPLKAKIEATDTGKKAPHLHAL